MKQVTRQLSFFRRHYQLLLAGLWLLMSLTYLLISTGQWYLGGMYGIVAVFYLISHFSTGKYNREFIAWDLEKIQVAEYQKPVKTYLKEEIQATTVTENNFILRSGAAAGVMMDITKYTPEDRALLKDSFSTSQIQAIESS